MSVDRKYSNQLGVASIDIAGLDARRGQAGVRVSSTRRLAAHNISGQKTPFGRHNLLEMTSLVVSIIAGMRTMQNVIVI
jgi:hypothetical protein